MFICCSGTNPCGDEAVAIDASASGILAKLPDFDKDEFEVECLPTRHNSKQHLLRSLHEREGVRHLLRLSLLSLSRLRKLGDIFLEGNDSAAERMEEEGSDRAVYEVYSDESDAIDLSKLASKLCQAKPTTRRSRRQAVLALVEPHISGEQRDRKSVSATELSTRCDADSIESNPGVDEIEEEAHELQHLVSDVVGLALNDVFVFCNSDSDECPRSTAVPTAANSPPLPVAAVDACSPNVASRRGNVEVSLFTAYVTLLILLLSDPIEAVWGGCDVATETWVRTLCDVLFDFCACDDLSQLIFALAAVRKVARKGSGQCPPLRFVRELCDSLTETSSAPLVQEDSCRVSQL